MNPSEVRTEFGMEYRDQTNEEKYPPGEVTEPETVAEAIAFAARQEPPDAVTELDLFRRDKFVLYYQARLQETAGVPRRQQAAKLT